MVELSITQLVAIVAGTAIGVYFISKCNTQRMIKFKLGWWFNHGFIRWCEHTDRRLQEWNKAMTKGRWLIFSTSLISIIFVPIMIWHQLTVDTKDGFFREYGTVIYLIEYFGLIGWFTFAIYRKKSKGKIKN